jgi:DNA-binding transcriptional MerR regulator
LKAFSAPPVTGEAMAVRVSGNFIFGLPRAGVVTSNTPFRSRWKKLIQVTMMHSTIGYGHDTVRRLVRICHLHRDLGLDLTAIDCILRMRRQIGKLQKQMHHMERRMHAREQELIAEIQRLRKQLAQESDWKSCLNLVRIIMAHIDSIVLKVNPDSVSFGDIAGDQGAADPGFQLSLNISAQRPRTIYRIIP